MPTSAALVAASADQHHATAGRHPWQQRIAKYCRGINMQPPHRSAVLGRQFSERRGPHEARGMDHGRDAVEFGKNR
jgi:hypothetical protein